MDARIFVEPQQGAHYADLLAVAQLTEELGYDAFFRSDHYLTMSGDGLPGPTDAWITLAALARETERVRLGTLVTSATFRLPGPLAIAVAQVDDMSGGRVELVSDRLVRRRAHAYGIPFPRWRSVSSAWRSSSRSSPALGDPLGEHFSFAGRHYRLDDSPHSRSRGSSPGRRSSSEVPGPTARRVSPPGSPTSSTCRSTGWARQVPSSTGCAAPVARPAVTRLARVLGRRRRLLRRRRRRSGPPCRSHRT